MTKGDNNVADDTQLFPGDQEFVMNSDVVGVIYGVVPFLGWPFLRINELIARPTTYTN